MDNNQVELSYPKQLQKPPDAAIKSVKHFAREMTSTSQRSEQVGGREWRNDTFVPGLLQIRYKLVDTVAASSVLDWVRN